MKALHIFIKKLNIVHIRYDQLSIFLNSYTVVSFDPVALRIAFLIKCLAIASLLFNFLLTTNAKVPKNSAHASLMGERDIIHETLLHTPGILFKT